MGDLLHRKIYIVCYGTDNALFIDYVKFVDWKGGKMAKYIDYKRKLIYYCLDISNVARSF